MMLHKKIVTKVTARQRQSFACETLCYFLEWTNHDTMVLFSHFIVTVEEQDTELKKLFRQLDNKSGILNWLIEGYRMLRKEGLILPEKVKTLSRSTAKSRITWLYFSAKPSYPCKITA